MGWGLWKIALVRSMARAQSTDLKKPRKATTFKWFLGGAALSAIIAFLPIIPAKWKPAWAGLACSLFMIGLAFFLMSQLDDGEDD
jgi:hypothetical protein